MKCYECTYLKTGKSKIFMGKCTKFGCDVQDNYNGCPSGEKNSTNKNK